MGPSIDSFLVQSANAPDAPGSKLSLTDFLNWEMTTGYRFAAITWHEDGTTVGTSGAPLGVGLPSEPLAGGLRDMWSPAAIGTHVQEAHSLLAQYPALAGTKVFVNEYGPTYAINIPGWMVGDFAALEILGADQGMMTCPARRAATAARRDARVRRDAADALLGDGRLLPDERPEARRHDRRLNLYALASAAPGGGAIDALVGRADDCFGGVQCPQFQASANPQVKLAVSVAVPWGVNAVNVSLQRFPDPAIARSARTT